MVVEISSYGFQIGTLYKILQNFRDQYNEILMSKHCGAFDEILSSDSYSPIVVTNEFQRNTLCDRLPLARKISPRKAYGDDIREQDFTDDAGDERKYYYPVQFPFSEFVPAVFEEVKDYVLGCIKFMDNLKMSQTDVEETIRRSTNLLFERFSGHLKVYLAEKLKASSLVQLIQITINVGYLEKSYESLEDFINALTGSSIAESHVSKLKQDMFRDARSEVEERIDEAMCQKIDEILSVAQYSWDMPESTGRASGYITDLIAFLRTTFVSFTNLPPVLARHICMQACKHLSSQMTSFLLDPEVKQVSSGVLEQFNLDVMQCELFTSQCPVVGFEDNTLTMTFAGLRQLIDLTMSADWSTYLADFGQERSKYSRVHPLNATCLLEKIFEYEKRKAGVGALLFSSKTSQKDKDKRKLYETVLKQLKLIASGGGSASQT
uniref:Exocyst complex component 6 n=1 Tax=Romanomermis culicivorax TaxID=13658 RepID=A0A915JDU7_ROMCU